MAFTGHAESGTSPTIASTDRQPAMGGLVALARNPIPSGAKAGTFKADDGVLLRYATWQPTRALRRGTVCVFPGLGEFIEKYFEVVADLRRRGFTVTVMDWRGQGGSARLLADPGKAHVRDFSEYDRDIVRFMQDIVLPDCPPPYIALAHSMGANVLLRNARLPGSWFERMLLICPMLELAAERVPVWPNVARLGCQVACLAGLGRMTAAGEARLPWQLRPFEGNPLTSDPERFARNRAVLDARPELMVDAPTFAWVRAAYHSMAWVGGPRYPAQVRVPLLVFAAGLDRVVSSPALEEFTARLKSGSLVYLANARHEILQERDDLRQRFWAAFDAYVASQSVDY